MPDKATLKQALKALAPLKEDLLVVAERSIARDFDPRSTNLAEVAFASGRAAGISDLFEWLEQQVEALEE